MGKGIGGYVRRCERHNRNPPGHLRQHGDGWPYRSEVFWQSMPILRFEPFDVEPENVPESIAPGVMDVVASFYAEHPK